MSQETPLSSLEAGEKEKDHKENKSPALNEHPTIINPWVCRTGRDKGPFMPPKHYIDRISRKTGSRDMDFIRKCYDEDYPVVNPDADSDFDRRGMPNGHDRFGNPTWRGGEVPKGIKKENMTAAALNPPASQQPQAPWQQPGADSCAARRAASAGAGSTEGISGTSNTSAGIAAQNGPASAPFDGDACAWARSHVS